MSGSESIVFIAFGLLAIIIGAIFTGIVGSYAFLAVVLGVILIATGIVFAIRDA